MVRTHLDHCKAILLTMDWEHDSPWHLHTKDTLAFVRLCLFFYTELIVLSRRAWSNKESTKRKQGEQVGKWPCPVDGWPWPVEEQDILCFAFKNSHVQSCTAQKNSISVAFVDNEDDDDDSDLVKENSLPVWGMGSSSWRLWRSMSRPFENI